MRKNFEETDGNTFARKHKCLNDALEIFTAKYGQKSWGGGRRGKKTPLGTIVNEGIPQEE